MPNEQCKQQFDVPGWKGEYYEFGENQVYWACIIYALISVDFFLAICIGSVLMTSMGQLAVELSHSVNYLHSQSFAFFCTRFDYKCKIYSLYVIACLFFIAAATWLVYSSVQLSKWGAFSYASDTTFDEPQQH